MGMACNRVSKTSRRRLSARTAFLGALLALPLASLAGCGDDSSTSSTPVQGQRAAGGLVAACTKISVARVAALVRDAGGEPTALRRRSAGTGELGRCGFKASGVNVELTLDANHDAVRGYFNRMTELSQFSSRSPDLRPQPVPGVGDRGTPGYGANWVAGFDQLYSVRSHRALTATFYARGAAQPRLRAGAIAVSRLAYAALGSPRATAPG